MDIRRDFSDSLHDLTLGLAKIGRTAQRQRHRRRQRQIQRKKTYGIACIILIEIQKKGQTTQRQIQNKDSLHDLDRDSAKKGRTTEDTRGQDAHTADNHKSPKKQIEQIFSRNSISRSDRESQIFSTNRRTCVRFFGQILEREKLAMTKG